MTILRTEQELEEVVLLDESGCEIGTLPKNEAHHKATPLHLAFSLFLFDDAGRFLIQQRAWSKLTWPGVWSNSCCGHPAPGEAMEDAVRRRARYELGVSIEQLRCALPDFRYRACSNGIWENEYCPVWIGQVLGYPGELCSDEVAAVSWESWNDFAAASARPQGTRFAEFSPWSLMEARQLRTAPILVQALARWTR
ncbi:isopentenyl-diphosphate Delta-isomerase [Pelagicoccus sp. SDUM812003]|uniref:isopentenyl-diphosphate Delta-isomerase n=1 Tax=Pelagicoccus sp. SDUM812003 TaxID=3041267 RepID=UPI00280DCDFD|nr:isopentenyl-diphosphate Delta-isomerase [Pelagicoccus sp. SDUM812003]MDQ8202249.1 isopentenyl-diphosphate Delta-isomerase [Pelagicoccus sp. SDUM812003]